MDPVVHFELPAENMDRAEKFYKDVFGWGSNRWAPDYFLVMTTPTDEKMIPTKAGQINGGLQKKGAKIAGTRVVVNVASIDEAIKKVETAGGKMVQPKTEIPDMLFYAVIADTEGNEVGLAQDIHKK